MLTILSYLEDVDDVYDAAFVYRWQGPWDKEYIM